MSEANTFVPIIERTPGYQALQRTPQANRNRWLQCDRRDHVAHLLGRVGIAIRGGRWVSDDQVLEAYRRLCEAVTGSAVAT